MLFDPMSIVLKSDKCYIFGIFFLKDVMKNQWIYPTKVSLISSNEAKVLRSVKAVKRKTWSTIFFIRITIIYYYKILQNSNVWMIIYHMSTCTIKIKLSWNWFILNVLVLEILYCIAQDICLVFIFVFKKRHVKPLPFDKNTLRYVMCTYFTECKK